MKQVIVRFNGPMADIESPPLGEDEARITSDRIFTQGYAVQMEGTTEIRIPLHRIHAVRIQDILEPPKEPVQ